MESEARPPFSARIKAFLFKNESAKQTIAKNSFWLSVSNFGGRFIKAAIVIYGARVLGTEGWGVFSYAITLSGFLTLFMDPGLNGILMRDIAKSDDEDRHKLFSTTFAMKIVLMLVGVGVIIFIAPFFSTLPGAKALLPIVAIILALDTLRDFFTSVARGMEHMEYDAAIFILTNIGILLFGFLFITLVKAPSSLAWAYVGGDILGISLAIIIIRTYFKDLSRHFTSSLVSPVLKAAWPFAVTSALGLLLTNADILILSWMRSASEVGIYSAAIRVVQVLYLVPTVIQFSTLPLFSRLAGKDNERFRAALERAVSIVFIGSLPLAIGGFILGTPIMTFIFGGAYASGSLAFKILMLTMIVDFPATIVSNAIFAYNHQRSLIITSAIAGALNVALDIILIPPFGMTGSAIGTLITQIVTNWYLWHIMKKLNYFEVAPHLKKIVFASAAMGLVTLGLYFAHLNVIATIVISVIVFFGALRLFREPLLIEMKRLIFPTQDPAAPIV
ncbi:MAG TPA: flippase [Candidatus Paceibacterota bacterium]|nr:flippase [Candidatus Paceibacterota bacterium]